MKKLDAEDMKDGKPISPIDKKEERMESLKVKPLRPNGGTPAIGKGGTKPMRMPAGRIATSPIQVRKNKPLRANNHGR